MIVLVDVMVDLVEVVEPKEELQDHQVQDVKDKVIVVGVMMGLLLVIKQEVVAAEVMLLGKKELTVVQEAEEMDFHHLLQIH